MVRLEIVAGLTCVTVTALSKVDTTLSGSELGLVKSLTFLLANFVKTCDWWLILSTGAVSGLCDFARRRLGNPWLWSVVTSTLSALQVDLFGQFQALSHENRVTLFRHCRFAFRLRMFPWSGWLVPVARSDHTTRNTWTVYKIGRGSEGEGVAGRAWAGTIFVPAKDESPLPSVSAKNIEANAVQTYAERTFITKGMLQAKLKGRTRPMPKWYVGTPIEVDGEPWGVLVVDSQEKIEPEHFEKSFRLVAATISKVLERC